MRPKASGALQTVVTLADCDDDDGCGDYDGDDNSSIDSSIGDDEDCKEGRRRWEDAR